MGSLPDIETRTLDFAIAVVRWAAKCKMPFVLEPVVKQLVKAGTGIGANRRSARRGRSYKEFTARLAVAVEEADESVYWLTVIRAGFPAPDPKVNEMLREATELRAILGAGLATARRRLAEKKAKRLAAKRAKTPKAPAA